MLPLLLLRLQPRTIIKDIINNIFILYHSSINLNVDCTIKLS